MRVSGLIKMLQHMKKEKGDLRVSEVTGLSIQEELINNKKEKIVVIEFENTF